MAETKSYRISEETQKRLEELSAEIGGNKDRVFNALMDTYAIQRETSNTAEDSRERIERFQQYAQYLVEAYIDSLKDVSAAEDRIRTEFRAQLQTQADAVISYKKQSEEAEKKASEAIQKASSLKETTAAEKERLEMQIAGLKAELAAAAEKAIATEEICSGYKAQIAALRTVESERDHYRDLIQVNQKTIIEDEMQSRESTIGKNEVPNRKSTISESEEQDETLAISEGREQDQNRAEPVNP